MTVTKTIQEQESFKEEEKLVLHVLILRFSGVPRVGVALW